MANTRLALLDFETIRCKIKNAAVEFPSSVPDRHFVQQIFKRTPSKRPIFLIVVNDDEYVSIRSKAWPLDCNICNPRGVENTLNYSVGRHRFAVCPRPLKSHNLVNRPLYWEANIVAYQ